MYKIEAGIPIPTTRFLHPRKNKYSFISRMNRGDSFLVKNASKSRVNNVRMAVFTIQKRTPSYKFVTRTLPEGLRVWRVK